MDRKHGKYIVNIEHSGKQLVSIDAVTVVSDSSESCFYYLYNSTFLLQHGSSSKGITNQSFTWK